MIEDLHWIDALSHDLLEGLAKALANHAVCFVLAYRPPQLQRLQAPRIEALEQFTRIELHELTTAEAESAVRAKLTQLYPARGGALPAGLVDALMRRAQGNPFYLEELLNYVRDRGLDPSDIQNIELPDSLHTLILSRIDQLSEVEKTTLRAASIVGRLFRAKWLTGYYPELGSFPQVKAALDELDKLEITPLDSPEPELVYLFKHIVTHEVTYESLPFATRARLHEQLARYLESIVGATRESPLLDTIVYHYLRSENKAKQMEYLRKAGEASQKNFANDAALEYYGQLVPLLKDAKEKAQIHLKRGEVLQLIGKWDDAETDYHAALDSADDDADLKASIQFALGKLNRFRGDYALAFEWLAKAKEARTKLEDKTGLGQVLIETGIGLWRKGEYTQAREPLTEGLGLVRDVGDQLNTALALNNLGDLTYRHGDYAGARVLYEEALALSRDMDNKDGLVDSLIRLGNMAYRQGNYARARALYEESLAFAREMGNKVNIAALLHDLGNVAWRQGDYLIARGIYDEGLALGREMGNSNGIAASSLCLGNVSLEQGDIAGAQALYEESLALNRKMGDKRGIAGSLGNLALVAQAQNNYMEALELQGECLALKREIGDKQGIANSLSNLGITVFAQGDYMTAREMFEESLALSKEMDIKTEMPYALLGLGLVDLAEGRSEAREHILHSLRLRQEMGERRNQTSCLIGAAGLVLQEGNAQFAAQLLGAVESALKVLNAVVEAEIKFFYEGTLAKVREALGEEAFQSAWEEGSQWSLEEAVKRALGE
ncbi:MAG: hypothetical protein C3F07_21160 [Anaerolineales bacterium]|nr:MAG: hypothetical protein C3F07_21160 [Anaerolineales bacterium]